MSIKKNPGTRNVVLLGVVSFLNDLSSEMILPILPLLIQSIGGTGIAVGLIGGIRDGGAELLKAFSGAWSDRIKKRKIFVYAGYLVSAIFKLFLLLAHTWPFMFLFVGLERIGKSLRDAPRDALIAQSMPRNVGKAFGIHRAFDNLGAILGSVIAAFLVWQWELDFKTIILIAALISFFSVIPLKWVREAQLAPEDSLDASSNKKLSRPFIVFTTIATIFSLGHASYMFFILRAQDILNHGAPALMPMLLYVFFNVIYMACSTPFGILSDRIGRWKMMTLGYALFALTSLGFMYAFSLHTLMICFALYGVALAIVQVNHRAYAADLASERSKATALGVFATSTGLALLGAGLTAGILWETIDHGAVFMYTGGLALFACFLLLVCKKVLEAH